MRYETTVPTSADPGNVWATWIDVEHWPDWTESVTSAERLDSGEFGVGSRARIKQPAMRPMVWTVIEAQPGRSFVWETRTAGTQMVAGHFLETGPSNTLNIRLSIDHSGLLAGLLGRIVGDRIRTYLRMEGEGVKRHAEARSAR
ncbi:SRPBCC family protein [Actinopolymorpha pittospori]|uniref:Membrane protein n=1 Tax=Actinopolymorpha pittospori TaxID=648752 RepID=A0A927RDD4_9ACTN|nr:SRPBCC family protein [Actinopolymorpha pittospori]MBE1612272.1 putative membrane protein [Actinopolymorpha pittospori]